MDDLFGDLVPVKPTANAAEVSKTNGADSAQHASHKPAGSGADMTGVMISLSKEDLEQMLNTTVQAAVDATFGKFAKSLRTVLEDMNKRIEGQTSSQLQLYSDLRAPLKELEEVCVRQAENNNNRFTSLDVAVREVERGVQAIRDKYELHEAQALLAKFSGESSVPEKKAAAEQPQGATSAPAPAPSASSPAVASAPAPAPAQSSPATAPFPTQPPMQPQPQAPQPVAHAPILASAPAAQYQPSFQPQPAPQHMLQQQPAGPEPQYSAPGAPQPVYPFRAPEGALPAGHQVGSGDQYHHMAMPPPQQQQQQQQQMAHSYPTQYPQMLQPQQRQSPSPTMQGPPPPNMAPMMPGMTPPGMYPVSRMPSYPAPVSQPAPSYLQSAPSGGSGGPPPQAKPTSRAVPLEQIITDITNMGFERHQVMTLVSNLQKSGQAVDLNMIIDKLTRGEYR